MTQAGRKLLVLDLDETLVHARESRLERAEDFVVAGYFVYRRPHLERFIEYALAQFNVGIWTSSGSDYAAGVVGSIFPPGALKFVWSSERCTIARDWSTGHQYTLKQLRKLKPHGYTLDSIIAVDDTPQKHARNYGNLVAVAEYLGQADDAELPRLMRYLEMLRQVPNVRAVEKRGWKTHGIVHPARPGAS